MSTATNPTQLDHLDSRIKSVWQRSQTLHLSAGALALFRWAVPLFLAGVAIDWLLDIPVAGRVAILITLLAVSLYKAWQCGWRNLRAFDATHTALQLETHHGGLESLLVSAVQLRDPEAVTGTSEALRDRTCRLAEEAASTLRPAKAVPFQELWSPAAIVLVLAGLLGVFAVVGGPFLTAGLSRIFAPWLAVEYPTYTRLELEDGDLVVKQGASAKINASVSGVVPNKAKLLLRTGEGRPREMVLDIVDGACEYTIASASRDFAYQIKAGDARSVWHRVRVIPAPRIERVKVELEFPAYLERATETVEALTLTAPEGTSVIWRLTLDRPIREAVFLRDGEEPLELQVSEDGRQVTFNAMASDSRGYHFSWVEKEHGFEFASPRYYLQVASDQPPQVELTSPTANLFAMPGRPLDLMVRARDDHALGDAKVEYRVNRRSAESVALPSPIRNGEGDQPVQWDYRTALPDLDVGDTVSFAVEVSDRYPEPQGPHRARSETRRITFLSKEEYLKQIGRKRDRLLSRVRTIYRQERAAHELVRNLNPRADTFTQTCQLEAIRQEMARNQLNETAIAMQALLDDLAANNVSDAPEGDSLVQIRAALQMIAEKHIARAASLLRAQTGATAGDTTTKLAPAPAARVVNTAARELSSLVLLRDIDSAQEVFARETHMLAQIQASLRWRTAGNESDVPALSKEQAELSEWTDRLISDLQNGMRYDKRPLGVLRLTRSVKGLRNADTEAKMKQAGELIRDGKADKAARLQADLMRTLLDAEFSVRLSGAYSTLIQTRNALKLLAESQAKLRAQGAATNAFASATQRSAIANEQKVLRKQLLTMLLSTAPAPRARLFDQAPPKPPPVEKLLTDANRAMAEALSQLAAQNQEAAQSEQHKAERALIELTEVVDRWSVEMGLQSQGLSTLVAATSERMSRLEEYEAHVIGLLDKTDLTAADDKNVNTLAESQQNMADDLGAFIDGLKKDDQTQPAPDLPPMLSRVELAEQLLNKAATALKGNDADQAIGYQEQAADMLAEAHSIVVAQNERLASLQGLLMFQRSVGFASRYMADIVAEQRDLLAETEALKPEAMKVLLPRFAHMRECMHDVAPLLDLVASRLDVGTPLAFAKTDFEDAMAALETGDKFEAIDAQDVAAESLGKVQLLIQDIRTQTGYLAEIVEYLHKSVSDASLLAYQQRELRQELLAAEQDDLSRFVKAQQALLTKAAQQDKLLRVAAGNPKLVPPPDPLLPNAEPGGPESVLSLPSEEMELVLEALKDNDAETAAEAMELVELLYTENAEAMLVVITMLEGLPQVTINSESEPALVRLVDTLAVASAFKTLFRQTQGAEDAELESLGKKQGELATSLGEIAAKGEPHLLLTAASKHLHDAASAFSPASREQLSTSQRAGDESLRHFIVEQALILNTSIPPGSASSTELVTDGPGSDTESDVTAGFISDFVSGEAPKDQRTGWNVRGDRNRAALNQNFARELPLEYRGLLKDYYQRVAK